jgi:hypothetical protein
MAVKCGSRISNLRATKENYTNEWKNNIIMDLNKYFVIIRLILRFKTLPSELSVLVKDANFLNVTTTVSFSTNSLYIMVLRVTMCTVRGLMKTKI